MTNDVEIFLCAFHLYIFWWSIYLNIYLIKFFYYLMIKSSLYFLDKSFVISLWFINIFSQSVAFPLILLTVIFYRAKFLFNFDKIQFIFMYCAFGVIAQKSWPKQSHKDFSPVNSVSFTVWDFIFRSMIDFEIILYMVPSVDQSSTFLHMHTHFYSFATADLAD